jgi:hypothetical protein
MQFIVDKLNNLIKERDLVSWSMIVEEFMKESGLMIEDKVLVLKGM